MFISAVHRALNLAPLYRGSQLFFGAGRARRKHVGAHIRPSPGDFVVDLGCGPGDILDYLAKVSYVGFNLNRAYIEAASSRYGDRGNFRVSSVNLADLPEFWDKSTSLWPTASYIILTIRRPSVCSRLLGPY